MSYKKRLTDDQLAALIRELQGYDPEAPENQIREDTPQGWALFKGARVLNDFLSRAINCYDTGRQMQQTLTFRCEGDLLNVYLLIYDLERKMQELREQMESVLNDYRKGEEECVSILKKAGC